MKTTDKFVLFWDGPFSNWYYSPFVYEGREFNCGEQYMMYQKAVMFNDTESAKKIMAETSPRKQKALGRKVKNFDESTWHSQCVNIMVNGLECKFRQNPDLLKILMETGTSTIVEASPYDKIWGIGLGEDDPRALNPTKWQGQNLLGITLMAVRARIRG